MYMCGCVCLPACVFVCSSVAVGVRACVLYVCIGFRVCGSAYVFLRECVFVRMCSCVSVSLNVCLYACVSSFVTLCACVRVCVRVCLYV